MATQRVPPKELEWGQWVIVGLTHYKVVNVFKRKDGGWNVRTVDRHGTLTSFQLEPDELILAVVQPRNYVSRSDHKVRIPAKNNRRYS